MNQSHAAIRLIRHLLETGLGALRRLVLRNVAENGVGRPVATASAATASHLTPDPSVLPHRSIEHMAEEVACFGRWSFDPALRRLAWSEGLARLHGRPMPTDGWLELEDHIALLHPDDVPEARIFLTEVVNGNVVAPDGYFSRRFRILRPDGELRHVAVHGQRTCDGHGATLSLDGITIDITDLVRSEQQLRETTTLLRSTLDNMDQGLVATDAALRVRLFNRRSIELLKLPERFACEGVHLAEVSAFMEARGDFVSQPNRLGAWIGAPDAATVALCYEREAPDGKSLDIRRMRLPTGGIVMTFTDATLRKCAERELHESEQRFRLLAENTNDVIILSDPSFKRIYVSPAIRAVLGYDPAEFVAMAVKDCVHPDDHPGFELIRDDDDAAPEEAFVTSARYRHKDGRWIWCEVSVRLVRDADDASPQHYVMTLRDISARHEAEVQIRHLALHDSLTGLPNRALLHDRLGAAIGRSVQYGKPCAVLACDLDRFKTINDTLGHPAGDALLRIVTDRMSDALRHTDMLARLGGDEFAVVLEDIDDCFEARFIAEQLIEAVGAPMLLDGQQVEIGVSIGIAVAKDATSSDELFKQADIALYQAKGAGRNTCRIYEPGAHMVAAARGQLALDMRDAMRRGDFRLVYQPIIEVATNRVRSFEALMRWHHPSRGLIPPGDFIPVAEESGMIAQLGAWALHEACGMAAALPSRIKVAVNVSAVQFRRPGLEEAVLSALAKHRLTPNRLKLEVTESVLLEDSEGVLACLHRLRGLGIRIALDDFGTGYSSLRYLRRFPFDHIKIDGSFVRDIADPDAAAIVRAIVSLGERLGIGITAECVETRDQLARLAHEGCTAVQGFLFSRPLEAEEALAYARVARPLAA